MKKNKTPDLRTEIPRLESVFENPDSSSLHKLSIEQLFDLLKIIIEIEDSTQALQDEIPFEAPLRTLH